MPSHPQFEAPETTELCELLPAYNVQTFIAQGGMGAVYLARQKSLDRPVAIKILPREFGRDKDFRKQFEAEAKAMALLNHPNLIGVYDFGEVDDMPYIVMEYVDGKSLHHSAHGKVIDQVEAGRLAMGICEGLAHAHEAGILHRDIKPANILLDSKARAKIGDFGLARAVESTEGDEFVFGTPGYTAPEVIKDPASVGKRSDVFSTGVILYELLTGELPGVKYVPASQKKKVDPRFDRIIRRATHPSPTLRYADGAAMASDLKTLLDALNNPAAASIITSAPALKKTITPKTGDPGDPTATPVPVIPEVAAPQGHSWALLRNMIIIAVLLAAIFGMKKALDWKKEYNAQVKIEQQQEESARLRREAAEREAARIAARERGPSGPGGALPTDPNKPTPPTPPTPPDPPREEGPLEALARLKRDLAEGKRSEFPPSTGVRGDNRFLFVDLPMSHAAAAAYAEGHGGQLATCPSEPDLNWLCTNIPPDTTVWLGGGATGRSEWGWIDGSTWIHRQPSTSTGTAAAITSLGNLKARPPGLEHSFFIQWKMDGSNPGSLKAQLARTSETLSGPNPIFPPGTFTLESRRYLLVARDCTWDEAFRIAVLAEGHLAVPSDQSEMIFLQELANKALPSGQAAWIGGQHNGRSWAWTTGEPWAIAAWTPGSPDGDPEDDSALRLVAGDEGGWDDADPNNTQAATALLIEWSKDESVQAPPATGELAKLQKLGRDAIKGKAAAYQKELAANGKSFAWDLRFWHKGMAERPRAAYLPGLNRMIAAIREDGSIPSNTPRAGLPYDATKILDSYLDKQKRIHAKLFVDAEKVRKSYLERLLQTRATLEERGLTSQVQALNNEVNGCGQNGESLLSHFLEDDIESPAREDSSLAGSGNNRRRRNR